MAGIQKKCIVVIPTHKAIPSTEEEKSFRNTLSILKNWDVVILLCYGISSEYYESIREQEKFSFTIIVGLPDWMGSLEKYNDMALSPEFYRLFIDYKYMLICHFDAWVFRDELHQWILKDYDYIGAPWFLEIENTQVSFEKIMLPHGGNGGFSLRKIEKMIEFTSKRKISINIKLFFGHGFLLFRNKQMKALLCFIRDSIWSYFNAEGYRKKYNINEDIMITIFYSLLDKSFKVAPPEEAINFATEAYSSEIFSSKSKQWLPFGIHGYEQYLPAGFIEKYTSDVTNKN